MELSPELDWAVGLAYKTGPTTEPMSAHTGRTDMVAVGITIACIAFVSLFCAGVELAERLDQ